MSDTIEERLRLAREALFKLQIYWLKKMDIALKDQRKIVNDLERERLLKQLES